MNEVLTRQFSALVREPATPAAAPPSAGNMSVVAASGVSDAEPEAIDDLGAFGWLRGIRERAIMLELRKATGHILAIDYGGLEIEFDLSGDILLYALSGRKVVIKGRNLNALVRPNVRLFQGLARHRVPWIAETGKAGVFQADRQATVIEVIQW